MTMEKIFDNLIQTAEDNAKKIIDNLYLDEMGFYCCKKCGTRKQVDIPYFGKGYKRVFCACKCEQNQYLLERKLNTDNDRIQFLQRYGFSNDNYKNFTFNVDELPNSQESQIARKYVANFKIMKESNIGLLFYGPCDTGKTFYMSCICNALVSQGYFVIISSLSELEKSISANYYAERNEILERIRYADLLILDDVGTERNTPTALESYFDIVNTRYISQKPMLISTNLEPDQLGTNDIKLQRIYQRIMQGTKKIKCTNPPRRIGFNSTQQDALKLLD